MRALACWRAGLLVVLGLTACQPVDESIQCKCGAGALDRGDTAAPGDDGEHAVPEGLLRLSPSMVDLGSPDPRCPAAAELVVANEGDAPLDLELSLPAGWSASQLAERLDPGAEATVTLTWAEPETGRWTGELVLTADGADHVLPMVSEALLPVETTTVPLGDRTTADLLLAVDRSCNVDDMAVHEVHWPLLRHTLEDAGVDLRMASVVADDACILGEELVAGPSMDDDAFRDRLWAQQDWDGDWGHYTEKLLELGAMALEKASGECNTGLLSGDAPVHLVGFSDEPDQSDISWEQAVSRAEDAVGDVPFAVHGIGGAMDGSCAAQPYTGVAEAAAATGGVLLSICADDKADTARALAEGLLAVQRRVVLTGSARDAELVAVRAEGAPLEGWSLEGDAVVLPLGALSAAELELELVAPAACGE